MIGEDEMNCVYEDLQIVKNVYNICDSINETYEDDNRNKDNHRNKEKCEGIEKDYEDGEKKTSENYIQKVNEIAEKETNNENIEVFFNDIKSENICDDENENYTKNEYIYPCNICEIVFAKDTVLTEHMKTDHIYPCNMCEIVFSKDTTLTENMKTDHASKTLSCNTTIDRKKENIKFKKKILKDSWEKYKYSYHLCILCTASLALFVC